jgi:hypothetical protein
MNMHGPTPSGIGTSNPPSGADRVSFSVSLDWPSRLTVPAVAACAYFKGRAANKPSRGSIATPLTILCAFFVLLALSAAVAQAEPPRLISDGTFDPGVNSMGVAVDNSSFASSGNVFVASLFNPNEAEPHRIGEFDASGKLISPPSPFGEGDLSGAAVDPVNGDLYVLEGLNFTKFEPAIATYDPSTGALVGTPFSVPASPFPGVGLTIVQIGVDAAGNVYVPVVPENEVLEYSPSGTLLKTFTGGTGAGALNGPSGVAVDSADDLWVADAGNNRIEELDPTGAPVEVNGKPVEIKSEGVLWDALDGHGDVFAIDKNGVDFCGSVSEAPPCSHLVEYDAAGAQVADVGAGSFETGNSLQLPPMVAVNQAQGLVYVTDAKGEKVWVFALPTAPRVENELSAEVTTSEAKLGALVNPGGIAATYRFEYLTEAAFQANGSSFSGPEHAISVPFPEGSVGEGLTSHTVWAAASGLAPGTTYHYRVVATSELAPEGVAGYDQAFTTETAEQAACPNEQFRGGFSGALPDCRAYELVTPATKTSVQINGGAPDAEGNAAHFGTNEPLPGAPTGGDYYVARRGAGGWNAEDVVPLASYTGAYCVSYSNIVRAFSGDLSRALIGFGRDSRASEPGGSELTAQECNAEGLQVVPGEPVGYDNLLLRDNTTGAYELVNAPPAGVTPADANFEGASADLSHVVFSELAALTPEAPLATVGGPEDLYEWDEGALRLLSVLPGEVPAEGALPETSNGSQPISKNGSHIVFTSGGSLYVRVGGSSTVQVDASQVGGGGGGGSFQAMSADGSTVLFTDENQLTPGSTAESAKPDLYECVLPEGASRCELSDLTVAKAGEPADVQRVSAFGSQDSSHVYFTARGVLAPGAQAGQENLYLWDAGTTTFIATLGSGEGTGAVSPDGTWFAFPSFKSLTGYDNIHPGGGSASEIFLYGAGSDSQPPTLACASCNPSGEAPVGGANLAPVAQRPLSDGGRLFFETEEALAPSDTNSQIDVYEYEDGRQSLISSGTSPRESMFEGASESGDNVFILSRQQLLSQDDTGGEARVIYDARVDGGFPAAAAPLSCTTADACRVPVGPLPSVFGAPASATFSGAGNLAPPPPTVVKKVTKKIVKCKKGFTKKKNKCVQNKKSKRAKKAGHGGRTKS